MLILFSLFIAVWLKAEIPRFAIRVNRQIYQETTSLVNIGLTEQQFLAQSVLQPKQPRSANLFFLLFPLIMLCSESPIIGTIFILLCFLSLLDMCYYLTDIRYL
ncbi:TPA: peptidase A24, partial [Mannheimia haemolytica]|nr:peptidase A24 [Mannheimia haemolytica]